ncbi:MAG: trigger factor [Candidatus Thioglobus sp.]|nr:trigger factor [Candidatus Thioglobus sp.]
MQISLAKLDGLKRTLTVELPAQTFKQKSDKILQKMSPSVAINGFRKGKVPLAVLQQQFGEKANSDAVNEIVNETLVEALQQAKVTPAERPEITKIDSNNKDNFSYTVAFEIYPEVKVANFSKLKIEQFEVEISPSDEEKTLNELLEKSTKYTPVKRKSVLGDQISVDFKGTISGVEFAGGDAKDFKLVLGKGVMIKGFEDGLLDASAEQKLSLDLDFPKDYHSAELAGKAVNFAITVNEISAPKVPKLDDDFAKKFGEKDIQTLKTNLQKQLRLEADARIANQNKEAIFTALLAANDFAVPQASIDNEAQNLLQEMSARLQQQGLPADNKLPASTFNPEAKRRVMLGLLIAQIAKEQKFTASKAQIDEKLIAMSQNYGAEAQKMIDYYNEDASRLSSIELLVVEKMVQEAILAKAKVSIKSKKFDEITGK